MESIAYTFFFIYSGYGFPNHTGDSNDFWRVQIDSNSRHPQAGQYLESRRSEFRLFHANQDCHLYSTLERLPEWGFQQQEVSCIQEGMKPKTMWIIDETMNHLLPANATMVPEHRPGFLEKFMRLHKLMWNTNNELTESHPYQSLPYEWPVLHSGIAFWISPSAQIILLGNPIVFWTSTVALFTFMILFGFFQLRDKRGFHDHYHGLRAYYEKSGGFFVLGWCLHYLPFYYLGRQLFLHHYMPALYFAVLTLGVGVDLVTRRFPQAIKMSILVAVSASIGYTYYVYSPITYGESWSVNECQKASLLSSWNLDCYRYTEYHTPLQHIELAQQDEQERGQLIGGLMSFQEPDQVVFTDKHSEDITALEDAPPAYLEQDQIPMIQDEYDEEDDDDDEEDEYELDSGFVSPTSTIDDYEEDEDEDEVDEPTEAPIYEEPEPEFIDGKEPVGEDDEEEDDWPKTIYGVDPEDEENPSPLTTREIPTTRLYY
jgi:dolichyl-phosphate-mannose-protein mannosyltransferase